MAYEYIVKLLIELADIGRLLASLASTSRDNLC